MPTMTRADSTEVYEHITKTLLGLEPTSPIMLALDAENLNTTMGILTLQVTDIPNLRFSRPKSKAEDPDEPPKHLSIGDKNRLRLFILWGRKLYREHKNISLDKDAWLTLDSSPFDEFCLSGEADQQPPAPPMSPRSPTPMTPTSGVSFAPHTAIYVLHTRAMARYRQYLSN